MSNNLPLIKLSELADLLNGELVGEDKVVSRFKSLNEADEGALTFLTDAKKASDLPQPFESSLICMAKDKPEFVTSAILVDDAYLAFAQASRCFDQHYKTVDSEKNIHRSAVISPFAVVSASAKVGENVVIGVGCSIGENVVIKANSTLADNVLVGDETFIWPNVSIYSGVRIGKRCIIQSGAVLGADGFGYAKKKDQSWLKIYQNGSLILEDDVEVGCNSSIDRGAVDNTIIRRGVKIDNICQIGHNVDVGEHSAMASMVGIAGSTKIGKRCTLGGQAGFAGHLDICDDVFFTGQAMVTKSINEAGVYSSGLPLQKSAEWRKNVAKVKRLPQLEQKLKAQIKQLETQLQDIENQS